MEPREIDEFVERHIRDFFAGHSVQEHQWGPGPAVVHYPNLRVLEIGPGPRTNVTTYVTRGAWAGNAEAPLEFLALTNEPSHRYVELLTIVAFYNGQHQLGVGHIAPMGEPLVPGSPLEHIYISLPYTFGPELEVLDLPDGRHVHLLWALPITNEERDLWRNRGSEALEEAFERSQVEYWNARRRSVAAN